MYLGTCVSPMALCALGEQRWGDYVGQRLGLCAFCLGFVSLDVPPSPGL